MCQDHPEPQPEAADLPHIEWRCERCGEYNSSEDAECQFCFYEAEDSDIDWEAIKADRLIDYRKHDR